MPYSYRASLVRAHDFERPRWKFVDVRHLFLFVEESIDQATQRVVFEPNDTFL